MARFINTEILAVILILMAIFRNLLYLGVFSGQFDIVLVAILDIIFLSLICLATYRLFNTPIFRSTLFMAAAMVGLVDRTHIKILALLLVAAFLRTLLLLGCFTGRLEIVLTAKLAGIFFAVIYLIVFLLRNAPVTQPTDDNNNEEDDGDEEAPRLLAGDDHNMESTTTSADHEVAIDDQDVEPPARGDQGVQSTTSVHGEVGVDDDQEHEPLAMDDTSMQSTTSDHAKAVKEDVDDQDNGPSATEDHNMESTTSDHASVKVDDDQDHHDPPTRDDHVDMPRTASDHQVDDDQDHDDPPTRDDHDMQSTGTASDHEVDDDQDVELASPAESPSESISPELSSLPSTFQPR